MRGRPTEARPLETKSSKSVIDDEGSVIPSVVNALPKKPASKPVHFHDVPIKPASIDSMAVPVGPQKSIMKTTKVKPVDEVHKPESSDDDEDKDDEREASSRDDMHVVPIIRPKPATATSPLSILPMTATTSGAEVTESRKERKAEHFSKNDAKGEERPPTPTPISPKPKPTKAANKLGDLKETDEPTIVAPGNYDDIIILESTPPSCNDSSLTSQQPSPNKPVGRRPPAEATAPIGSVALNAHALTIGPKAAKESAPVHQPTEHIAQSPRPTKIDVAVGPDAPDWRLLALEALEIGAIDYQEEERTGVKPYRPISASMELPSDSFYTDLLAAAVSRPNTGKATELEKMDRHYGSNEALADIEKLLSKARPWPAGYASGGLMRIIKKRAGVTNLRSPSDERTLNKGATGIPSPTPKSKSAAAVKLNRPCKPASLKISNPGMKSTTKPLSPPPHVAPLPPINQANVNKKAKSVQRRPSATQLTSPSSTQIARTGKAPSFSSGAKPNTYPYGGIQPTQPSQIPSLHALQMMPQYGYARSRHSDYLTGHVRQQDMASHQHHPWLPRVALMEQPNHELYHQQQYVGISMPYYPQPQPSPHHGLPMMNSQAWVSNGIGYGVNDKNSGAALVTVEDTGKKKISFNPPSLPRSRTPLKTAAFQSHVVAKA
ncbi:hypothetical protein SeMB42_g01111 [Synchytrium endobioticum]|uniref:Uncharacterized protein n=1 Tax=Synchytrium endobioticum TaxID=286115 RepID=A0A507DMY9_9FUNG|nr:hypothetical protein SeMB42_g01111 [Synchytrium endobioticum]